VYNLDPNSPELDPRYLKGKVELFKPQRLMPHEILPVEQWAEGAATYTSVLKRFTAIPQLLDGATMQRDDFKMGKVKVTAGRWGMEYPLSKVQEGRMPGTLVNNLKETIMADVRHAAEAEFQKQLKASIVTVGDEKNTIEGDYWAANATTVNDPFINLDEGADLMEDLTGKRPNYVLGTNTTLSMMKHNPNVLKRIGELNLNLPQYNDIKRLETANGMALVSIPKSIYLSKDDAKATNLASLADNDKVYLVYIDPVPENGLGVMGTAKTTNGPANGEELVMEDSQMMPKIWRGATSGVGGGSWYYRTEKIMVPAVLNTGCVVEITGVNTAPAP